MRRLSSTVVVLFVCCFVVVWGQVGDPQTPRRRPQRPTGPPAEYPLIPKAPDTVKPGQVWIPPMPAIETLGAPAGWKPEQPETPAMPVALLRLPRTNITRAKFPTIDFHVHAGGLSTTAAYESLVKLLDEVGVAAIVNLNGGTGATLDTILKAGEPYRDRVANLVTLNTEGINESGWSAKFAAETERGFKAGAMGLKVSKGLGLSAKNPDGTFIQADDPRLDAVWEMAAKYNKPVMIHISDSVGRFYPISPKNERYEAGLWHTGDDGGNYYNNGYPSPEVLDKARENMHAKHPKTIFVHAHMAMLYYDPDKVAALLDKYPNAQVDISATIQDLGRAPILWRKFLIKYQDRILMGSDGSPNRGADEFWTPHWRFLETFDEHFDHPAQLRSATGAPGHGRWKISGIGLPDEVLRKIEYENALKYLPSLRDPVQKRLAALR